MFRGLLSQHACKHYMQVSCDTGVHRHATLLYAPRHPSQPNQAWELVQGPNTHQNTHVQLKSCVALGAAGTSPSMQGLFSLMQSFEAITEPAMQKQLLEHSLQLLELSQGSRVRLLRHEARSAAHLMEMLRHHAPETLQDDHLLMLQGPFQDMVLPSFPLLLSVFLDSPPPLLCHSHLLMWQGLLCGLLLHLFASAPNATAHAARPLATVLP